MKVSFFIKSKNLGISETKSIDFSYEECGYICSLIFYGNLKQPEIALASENSMDFPLACHLYVLDISWSKYEGFKFKQYLDPSMSSSLLTVFGSLKGYTQIQIAGLISLIFRAEVDSEDLGGSDKRVFLDNANKYGITIKNVDFSNAYLSGLDLSHCQFIDVSFSTCSLEEADFSNCRLTNVRFAAKSNLGNSKFRKAVFNNVEFENSSLDGCDFQECEVKYSARKIWDETVLKISNCELEKAIFRQSQICLIAEGSDLRGVDFSQAELVACRFYNCHLDQLKFVGSKFTSSAEVNKLREQYPDLEKFICKFGRRNSNTNEQEKGKISGSSFAGASMARIDLSNNHIENCHFEDADLRNASLHHCKINNCEFQRVTLNPARCSFANFSYSEFQSNKFYEVDFYKSIMVSVQDTDSEFVNSNFYKANLKDSIFYGSDLRGTFLGEANLTLASFDRCKLNGSNFHQTQRSGIDLHIKDAKGNKVTSVADLYDFNDSKPSIKALPKLQSTCEIGNVQWYSNSNGEILIEENTFLHIIIGSKSPIAVLASLTKENPNIISIMNQNQASADSRSAGHDQVNADTKVDSVTNGSVKGSDIRIGEDIGNNVDEDSDLPSAVKEQPIPDDIVSNDLGDDSIDDA